MSPTKKKLLAQAASDDSYEARVEAARAYALAGSESSTNNIKSAGSSSSNGNKRQSTPPAARLSPPPLAKRKKPSPPKPIPSTPPGAAKRILHDFDEDYARFVESLGGFSSDLASLPPPPEDDDQEFYLEEKEDSDEEDLADFDFTYDEDSAELTTLPPLPPGSPTPTIWASNELEEELSSLLEEDLEAALHVLGHSPPPRPKSPAVATPLRDQKKKVTPHQRERLAKLMRQHYQLLIQQAVLSIKGLQKETSHQESPDDLAEILDGAVGMLQDLDQNRKDAIRNSIQLETAPKRKLFPIVEDHQRLTRSAFERTLQNGNSAISTSFHVLGLEQLSQTFETIDLSLKFKQNSRETSKTLMQQAGAIIDESLLPNSQDLSLVLSRPTEVFPQFKSPPLTSDQQMYLRKNRNLFTAAEDNLVLRGVNLYGEKQWLLIADRYLPDRSVNIISQRYSKLCVLVYEAQGVDIDAEGNLVAPPTSVNVAELDESLLEGIQQVKPPAILNVHRWSLEEDICLLKTVPIFGNQWAELSTRFIPHRERGHLRKRYQVLERRVKATVQRAKKTIPAEMQKFPATKKRKTIKPQVIPPSIPFMLRKQSGSGGGLRPASKTKNRVIRKPGFPLPLRANAAASTGTMPPTNGTKVDNGSTASTKPHYGSLPAASSPELDATATNTNSPDASRKGFERILEEGTNDWSQMPRIKKMMENDRESMVASAILANASKVERLPQFSGESNMSGVSLLNESPAKPRARTGSIMASVLERTARKKPPNGDSDIKQAMPSTPSRTIPPYAGVAPTTPVGLSPAEIKSGLLTPAGMRYGFTPTGAGKTGFTPTGFGAWNSAAAAHASSTDGFDLCSFEISEQSRQAIESRSSIMNTPNGNNNHGGAMTFGDGHSLMANDFEAISALNSLSNSPARSLVMKPNKEKKSESSKPTSLFAQAIGGIQEKESKKRRTS